MDDLQDLPVPPPECREPARLPPFDGLVGSLFVAQSRIVESTISAGRLLMLAHQSLAPADFAGWAGTFGWTDGQARRLMRMADRLNFASCDRISPSAMCVLSAPRILSEALRTVRSSAARGHYITARFARDAIRRAQQTGEETP